MTEEKGTPVSTEHLPSGKREEDFRINLLKGFCIVGVACIHFGGSFVRRDLAWTGPFYMGLFLNQFFSFAVPVFIFISGWLLDLTHGDRPIHYGRFYRKRLVKLGIPYLIVTALFFILFPRSPLITSVTWQNFLPRVFYYGIEPTLYFVPLIIQLYLLYPLLRLADRKLEKPSEGRADSGHGPVLRLLLIFFVLHILIGFLAYSGKISYHTLCLRFFPFWILYFYGGMHFRGLTAGLRSVKKMDLLASLSGAAAVALFFWNISRLMDVGRVGLSFERNMLDFAYCRPEILPYDLAAVLACGMVLQRPWTLRVGILETFGVYSYHLYVWHILVLLHIGWGQPAVMAACIAYPEVIPLVAFAACAIIAGVIIYCRPWYLAGILIVVGRSVGSLVDSFQAVRDLMSARKDRKERIKGELGLYGE